MNIMCLLASPRPDSGGTKIAKKFLDIAAPNHSIQKLHLHSFKYRGCQSCEACRKRKITCIINDELYSVFQIMDSVDVLIIALPVYYTGFNSSIMAFLERSMCYYQENDSMSSEDIMLSGGKTVLIIQTQASMDKPDKFVFSDHFERLGFEEQHFICASEDEIKTAWDKIDRKISEMADEIFGL